MRAYSKRYGDAGRFRQFKGRREQCPCCPPKFQKGDRTPKRRVRTEGKDACTND